LVGFIISIFYLITCKYVSLKVFFEIYSLSVFFSCRKLKLIS